MLENPKISIIIPVYNGEKYLKKCLDSVINQSLNELEIICVENGSTDRTLQILKEYRRRDSRLVVLNLSVPDVGKARNYGSAFASGEFLMFVDSDDYIRLDCCEILYKIAHENNLDILQAMAEKFPPRRFPHFKIKRQNFNTIMAGMEFWQSNDRFAVEVWNKLWKRDFYIENEIYNPEKIFAGDTYASLSGIWKARRFMAINECLYYYRNNPESITNSPLSQKYIMSYVTLVELIKKFIIKNHLEENVLFMNFYFNHVFLNYVLYQKDADAFRMQVEIIDKSIVSGFPIRSRLSYFAPALAAKVYPVWRAWTKLHL